VWAVRSVGAPLTWEERLFAATDRLALVADVFALMAAQSAEGSYGTLSADAARTLARGCQHLLGELHALRRQLPLEVLNQTSPRR